MSCDATRAVFLGPGSPLRIESINVPPPQPAEAIVQVEMCTICGSDLHTFTGRRAGHGEQVLGHEILGRVAAVHPEVPMVSFSGEDLQVGDRVTWTLHASCGRCFWCQHQLSQKCVQLFKYGHAAVSHTYPITGGMATHCQLRAGTAVFRIPDELDARLVGPANCATATVAAAFRQLERSDYESIVVLGAGMLGLTATAWACERGISHIGVLDPDPARLTLAERFGATWVGSTVESAREHVHAVTDQRGADVAMDFSGHPTAVQNTLDLLRIGGEAIWVGSVFPTEPLAVVPELIVRQCLRIVGIHNYLAEDLAAAIEFLVRHGARYPFAAMVQGNYAIDQANEAVEHAMSGEAIRVAITPSNGR